MKASKLPSKQDIIIPSNVKCFENIKSRNVVENVWMEWGSTPLDGMPRNPLRRSHLNCHLNNKKEPARQKSGIIAFYVERWQGVAWGRQYVQRFPKQEKAWSIRGTKRARARSRLVATMAGPQIT